LLALSDNGYVSTYWYDGAGERTVKQSGDALSMAVNGTLSGASTGTTNFTAYVNPYTVINNGNQMSKHIYVGTQRIVSKLCDAGAMADPTMATKATYTGSILKYADKYKALTATVKARYDSLGVAYNGTDKNGVGFYKSSKDSTSVKYYYHSDHLGSANYITDANGDVAQHLEYIPYGETFVDERYSTWHSPYKFNGKERDEETGLTYYSQRYFDGNVWLSVDPLAEGKPNIGSYVYCLANPVNMIDPDGRWEFSSDGKSAVAEKGDNAKTLGKFLNIGYKDALGKLKNEGYNTTKKGGKDVLNLDVGDEVKLDVEVPDEKTRSRMGDAVDRSNNPSSEANDLKGGLHEEGGYYGKNASGQDVVIDAAPGSSYKKGESGAGVNSTQPNSNYNSNWRDFDQKEGTFHVHPKGSGNVQFKNSPSPADLRNSVNRYNNGMKGNSYVLTPRNNTVYIYRNGVVLKQYPLEKFRK
jgi:RHS repeat-associated protein